MTEEMQNGRKFRCKKYLKMRRRVRVQIGKKMDKSNNQEGNK